MGDTYKKNQPSRFRGRSEHALDGKGRLNVPSRFRDVLLREYDDRLIITPPWPNCLRIYPLPEWEKQESSLLGMEQKTPKVQRMIRYLVGGSVECQVDKNGRILLPVQLRNQLDLKKEVVMNGMLTFFEIWSKEAWEKESIVTEEDFKDFETTFNDLGLY
ncbi:MAG: division/cell wall cluster transcriptional repressor MraZ [Desulfobulbaceae bacterium]|nr:division/cell wall cluster transcriptional repressor MraZ [Desulfobulbaceae bacterium]